MTEYKIHLGKSWKSTATGKILSHSPQRTEKFDYTSLSGFYAYVIESDEGITAGVDHVRSIPLFYAKSDDTLYLSDSAEWVANHFPKKRTDTVEREFQLTGFVSGRDTLHPDVKQLLPGDTLYWRENELRIKSEDPYRYKISGKGSIEDAIEVAEFTIQKLINYANGKQIIIPLSGGLDSLLIAALLVQQGYDNLISITYGRQDSVEVSTAKNRAEALGVDWQHIEYNHKVWQEWYTSKNRHQFYDLNDSLAAIPHIEMGPALAQLSNQDCIEPNAVVVPGHSGDMLAGSHLPKSLYQPRSVSKNDIIEVIIQNHYWLDKLSNNTRQRMIQRLDNQLNISGTINSIEACETYEEWDFNNRQSKFIINSMRVVESYDFDWYLPLWDENFLKFWLKVPIPQRINQELYTKMVQRIFNDIVGENTNSDIIIEENEAVSGSSRLLRSLKSTVRSSTAEPVLRPFYDRFIASRIYYNSHPLGWYGVVPKDTFQKLYFKGIHLNSFIAKDILGEISLEKQK